MPCAKHGTRSANPSAWKSGSANAGTASSRVPPTVPDRNRRRRWRRCSVRRACCFTPPAALPACASCRRRHPASADRATGCNGSQVAASAPRCRGSTAIRWRFRPSSRCSTMRPSIATSTSGLPRSPQCTRPVTAGSPATSRRPIAPCNAAPVSGRAGRGYWRHISPSGRQRPACGDRRPLSRLPCSAPCAARQWSTAIRRPPRSPPCGYGSRSCLR